ESIKIYLANDYDQENQNTQEIRKELRKSWGNKEAYKKALKNFPNYLRYERTMLHRLYENPSDFVGALNNLPKNLLNLFIHAYQSYLFNKTINERINRNISLRKPIMGDVVCYTDLETGIPNRNVTERVTEKNREKIEEMIEKRKAYVTAPLFGKKTKQALGEMGEIEEKILEQENIGLTDFEIKKIPEISSSGLRREIITFPNFDSIKKTKSTVTLRFFLPKGSYATCVTREFRGELNGK
ncbi:tRNA pseudouridine(13) synthase TruD, partial [archaeon SCG-AAA382B04]